MTPLIILAAEADSYDCCRVLLDAGAYVDDIESQVSSGVVFRTLGNLARWHDITF